MILKDFCSHANWLAIIVAALVYFILGALWYSLFFQKPWMAGHNISPPTTPEAKEQMKKTFPLLMIKTFVMNVVMAIAIGILVRRFGSMNVMAGAKLGLLLSAIGIIPMAMSFMYLMKSFKIILIDGAYHLVGITLMTIIISIWH
jgi:heme/copper-type cytochrome/quinol oxidase subunit 2